MSDVNVGRVVVLTAPAAGMALALFVAFFIVPGMNGDKGAELPHSKREAKPPAATTGGARKAGGGAGAKGGSGRPGGGSSTGGGKASSSSSSASSSSNRPSASGVRQRVGGIGGSGSSGGSREERAKRNEVLSLLTNADGEFNEAGAEDDAADGAEAEDDAALTLGGAVPKVGAIMS